VPHDTHIRGRETEAGARERADRRDPKPDGESESVLALQRSAGNAAVARLLRGAPAGVLWRDRKLPEDADSLTDVASAAKELKISTDAMVTGSLGPWFKGARGTDRDEVSVSIRFPGAMAAPKADEATEKKIRTGLSAIAMAFFRLRTIDTAPPLLDVVSFAELDLTDFGGVDGSYRFTCVTRTPKKGKNPAAVDMIIERIGPARQAFKPWSALDAQRRSDLEARFAGAGYTQAQSVLGGPVVDTWTKDQFGNVLQALEAIPEATLRAVPDIVWERAHKRVGPNGEGGYFEFDPNKKTRHLTIYDDAFRSDNGLVELIAHEIGHALSYKPPSEKAGAAVAETKAFQDAAKADGRAITDYAKQDWHEHYAEAYAMFISQRETMRILRPALFAWFTNNPTGAPQAAKKPPKP